VEKFLGVTPSLRSTALAVLVPALAVAQENAGTSPAPTESKLWWMWIALAVLLVGAIVAVFASRPGPAER
jgi:hypothetical protein